MKAADRCGDEGVKSAVLAEEDETKRLCGASPSLTRRTNPSFLSSHLCSPPEPRPPPPRSDYTAEWVLCFKCQSGAGTEVCVFTTSGLLKAIRMMLALLPRSRGGAALMKSSISPQRRTGESSGTTGPCWEGWQGPSAGGIEGQIVSSLWCAQHFHSTPSPRARDPNS